MFILYLVFLPSLSEKENRSIATENKFGFCCLFTVYCFVLWITSIFFHILSFIFRECLLHCVAISRYQAYCLKFCLDFFGLVCFIFKPLVLFN